MRLIALPGKPVLRHSKEARMPPAARMMDMTACPMQTPATPPIPHVGGPITTPCSMNVITCFMNQSKLMDMAICAAGPPATLIKGSMTVMVNFVPAIRIGDVTDHGGQVVSGAPTVMIGG